jgi:hypothetical protein
VVDAAPVSNKFTLSVALGSIVSAAMGSIKERLPTFGHVGPDKMASAQAYPARSKHLPEDATVVPVDGV